MREKLFGTWHLESLRRFRNEIFNREPMGAGTQARIIYDASGHMSAFLMAQAFKRGEVPQTWDTFLSYSGRWSLPDERTVVHDVDFCSIPAMIGTPLVRYVTWQGDDTIVLKTAAHTNKAGERSHDELIWHRVKA